MSSKKITAADKLEIVDLYRQAGDTTASLATRYGVSNSTISRLLKTSIPEAEYEILIQQKRVSKVGNETETLTNTEPIVILPTALTISADDHQTTPDLEVDPVIPSLPVEDINAIRRLRRRASAPLTVADDESGIVENLSVPVADIDLAVVKSSAPIASAATPPIPLPRTPVLREILADSEHRYTPSIVEPSDELEEEEDEDNEDVNALAAMFGEEIADDEDDEDDEDDDESTTSTQLLNPLQLLTEDRLHVQITPLSQATLPRTCYIVIDKFAELIVRPLKDFADLGQISGEETQQRTLPIFDNHRVAKRFSNQRTQRVIKVPDSRVFYKTTQHLKLKGITRLLVDGNIYSLN